MAKIISCKTKGLKKGYIFLKMNCNFYEELLGNMAGLAGSKFAARMINKINYVQLMTLLQAVAPAKGGVCDAHTQLTLHPR